MSFSTTSNRIAGFDLHPRTRFVFGAGVLERLGELCAESGARRVLLVTDPGIAGAGHVSRAVGILERTGLKVFVFDGAVENPTPSSIQRCAEFARRKEIDHLVGLGGGSSLDTAKACNFLLTSGGRMEDYRGYGKALHPMLPFFAVPTSAGTGSESQSYAVLSRDDTHEKMACGDPKAAARVALLDPELTVTQPREITAQSGTDALSHAVETAVTRKRNPLSLLYSRESFRLIMESFPAVLDDSENLEARARMQLAACFAGTAIENSMLGAVHASANPLTARFGIVHGEAVGLMLRPVVAFNGRDEAALRGYKELAVAGGVALPSDSPEDALARLLEGLDEMLRVADMPLSLSQRNVPPEAIPRLAADATAQWTGNFNPRSMSVETFEELYRLALEPDAAET